MEEIRTITGHTGLMAVLGSPIRHSLSPAMHNEAFRLLGLDYVYLAFEVKETALKETLESFRRLGVRGCNLTMPLKTQAVELMDELSPAARIAGSVNTVVFEPDGRMVGHTTDGYGFTESARQSGVDFTGKKVTILGTGGAGIAILIQMVIEGAGEIVVFERPDSRFRARTERVVRELADLKADCPVRVLPYEDANLKKELSDTALLVNTTNVGMSGSLEGQSLISDAGWFHKELVVSDVIYQPRKTRLIEQAEEKGLKTFNGMYMLLYQGARSFSLWTGKEMPAECIKAKYFS